MKLRPPLLPPPPKPSRLKLLPPLPLRLLMPSPLKALLPLRPLMPSRLTLLPLPLLPRLVPPPRTPLLLPLPLPKRSNSFPGEEKANLRVGFFTSVPIACVAGEQQKTPGLPAFFAENGYQRLLELLEQQAHDLARRLRGIRAAFAGQHLDC